MIRQLIELAEELEASVRARPHAATHPHRAVRRGGWSRLDPVERHAHFDRIRRQRAIARNQFGRFLPANTATSSSPTGSAMTLRCRGVVLL
jgi:hypothetical protein